MIAATTTAARSSARIRHVPAVWAWPATSVACIITRLARTTTATSSSSLLTTTTTSIQFCKCFSSASFSTITSKAAKNSSVHSNTSSDNFSPSVGDNNNVAASAIKSKRKLFKEIPVYPHILAHIQEISVGIIPRPRKAKKLAKIVEQANRRKDNRKRSSAKSSSSVEEKSTQTEDAKSKSKSPSDSNPLPPYDQSPYAPPRPFGKHSFKVRVAGQVSNPNKPQMPEYMDNIPQRIIPQVAICGRSNVGKSTLLNTLMYSDLAAIHKRERDALKAKERSRRDPNTFKLPKGLKAVTSPKPGETREITFYQLGSPHPKEANRDLRLLLVDLPGYGFAYASPEEHLNFQKLMVRYLTGTLPGQDKKMLKRVLLLIDARHGMKKADIDFLEMIQTSTLQVAAQSSAASEDDSWSAAIGTSSNDDDKKQTPPKRIRDLPPIQVVLTKCDLVEQLDLARRVVQVQEQLSGALYREPAQLPVLLTSARNNNGILEVQKHLAKLAVSVRPVPPPKKPPPQQQQQEQSAPVAKASNDFLPVSFSKATSKGGERVKKRWPKDPKTGKRVRPPRKELTRAQQLNLKKQLSQKLTYSQLMKRARPDTPLRSLRNLPKKVRGKFEVAIARAKLRAGEQKGKLLRLKQTMNERRQQMSTKRKAAVANYDSALTAGLKLATRAAAGRRMTKTRRRRKT